MPTPKLFVKQYQAKDGTNYMIYRYWDNHLNNYEYQVYELVMAKPVARTLGAPEFNENGGTNNTRVMCDWVWVNCEEHDGHYREQ